MLDRAAARALVHGRRQEDLDLSRRRDDRADVAPLGHPIAMRQQLALLIGERRTHLRPGGRGGRESADLRIANGRG